MGLSTLQWHQRYQQQAGWTRAIRDDIYDHVGLSQSRQILDIGCGTGVLEQELSQYSSLTVYGLDIEYAPLSLAKKVAPGSIFALGDAQQLPFKSGAYDITFCHFLLLWVKEPIEVINEMVRVTKPGGHILVLAEPDYGGRIDFPLELSQVGSWQTTALKEQGANPFIGRELRSLFSRAGLKGFECGVLGGQWGFQNDDQNVELEWEVLHSDLKRNPEFLQKENQLKGFERQARETHQRILFVPTFYAFGQVSG